MRTCTKMTTVASAGSWIPTARASNCGNHRRAKADEPACDRNLDRMLLGRAAARQCADRAQRTGAAPARRAGIADGGIVVARSGFAARATGWHRGRPRSGRVHRRAVGDFCRARAGVRIEPACRDDFLARRAGDAGGGLVRPLDKERVTRAEDLSLPDAESWNVIGSGWDAYRDALRARFSRE